MNMKRLIWTLISFLGLITGCSKGDILTPSQFTAEIAEILRNKAPELRVVVVRDLELKFISKDGSDSQSFLYNIYDAYKLDPKEKSAIIDQYVASWLENRTAASEEIDEQRIVPVIKDKAWLEETKQSLRARGETNPPEHLYDDLNGDLVILYAQDSPRNIRYLNPSDAAKLKVARSELRELACSNLRSPLPRIEPQGEAGQYVITAGGDYETSLLLFDEIWSKDFIDVDGDFVVAIPERGLLLVTGSKNNESIARLKTLAKKLYDEGSYRLTPRLFVRRNGKFARFEE